MLTYMATHSLRFYHLQSAAHFAPFITGASLVKERQELANAGHAAPVHTTKEATSQIGSAFLPLGVRNGRMRHRPLTGGSRFDAVRDPT